jgi:hypothetical protein
MSCKYLLHAGILFALSCFFSCTFFHRASTKNRPPSSKGNQYFNKRNAKFLDCDSTAEDTCWLVDRKSFDSIKNYYKGITGKEAISALQKLDKIRILINDDSIQTDLQAIEDSTSIFRREYQVLLYLDLDSGDVLAVFDSTGDNHNSSFGFTITREGNFISRPVNDSPVTKLIIGQAHGHPEPLDKEDSTLVSIMSDSDRHVSNYLHAPVYAIEAGEPLKGQQGNILRVVPNQKKIRSVGKTKGGFPGGKTFNMGLDALMIWSRGSPVDSNSVRKVTPRIQHAPTSSP